MAASFAGCWGARAPLPVCSGSPPARAALHLAAGAASIRSPAAAGLEAASMARAAPPTLPPLLPAGTFRSHIAGRSPARWTGPQRASQFPFDVTEALYEATGVPLIDELMAMGTLEAAAQRSARLAGVALAVGMLGTLALRAVARRASSSVAAPGGGFNAFPAAAASALEPLQALLPYGTGVYLLTLGASLAQVAVARRSKQFAFLCCGLKDEVLSVLKTVTQLLQDTTELFVIVVSAWWLIEFKNRTLQWLAAGMLSDDQPESGAAVVSFLRPLSSMLNLLVVAGAVAAALAAYGINLAPLMASLGGLGIVIGLASQGFVKDILSAVALYTARPYNIGDEIYMLNDGSTVLQGTVARVEPLRTIMHLEDGALVYINNSDVARYAIKNVTQGQALRAIKDLPSAAEDSVEAAAAELLDISP